MAEPLGPTQGYLSGCRSSRSAKTPSKCREEKWGGCALCLIWFRSRSALCETRGKETSVPLYIPHLSYSKSGGLSTFKENSLSAKQPVGRVQYNWHMGLQEDKWWLHRKGMGLYTAKESLWGWMWWWWEAGESWVTVLERGWIHIKVSRILFVVIEHS